MKKFNKTSVIKIVASALGTILVLTGGILTYKHFKNKPNAEFDFKENTQKEIVSGFAKCIKLDKEVVLVGLGTDKDTEDVTNYISLKINDWETLNSNNELTFNSYIKTYASSRIINLNDKGLVGDIIYEGLDLDTLQLQNNGVKNKENLKVDITHATNNTLKVLDKSFLENVIGRVTSVDQDHCTNGYVTFTLTNSISKTDNVIYIKGKLELDEQGNYRLTLKDNNNPEIGTAVYKK